MYFPLIFLLPCLASGLPTRSLSIGISSKNGTIDATLKVGGSTTTTSTLPSVDFGDSAKFQSEALSLHNSARKRHDAAELKWDAALEDLARITAGGCKCGFDGCSLDGSPADSRDNTNELVARNPSSLSSAFNTWYNQSTSYSFATGASLNGADTSAFTQLVWKDTSSVGCAAKQCRPLQRKNQSKNFPTLKDLLDLEKKTDGVWFVVCEYRSKGNVEGRFVENVKPSGAEEI